MLVMLAMFVQMDEDIQYARMRSLTIPRHDMGVCLMVLAKAYPASVCTWTWSHESCTDIVNQPALPAVW